MKPKSKLKRLLKERGIFVYDLAKQIVIVDSYLSQILNGYRAADWIVEKICAILDIEADDYFEVTNKHWKAKDAD